MARLPAYIPFFHVTGFAAVLTNFVAARSGSMGRFFFRGAGVARAAVATASSKTADSIASSEGAAASVAGAASSAPASSSSSAHRRVNAAGRDDSVTDAGVTNAVADEAVSERSSAL